MAKKMKVVIQTQKKKKNNSSGGKDKKEVTELGKVLRTLGGLGGSALGGMIGQPTAGGALGNGLGAVVSRWLGQGDYNVTSNSIVKSALRASTSIPSMHKEGQTITVRHKEFIASIKGSTNFDVQRFFILQPGDANTFPWASGIAEHFQQYRIKGMVYHYVPTSGYAVSGTNAAIGAVMMQTSYRVNDAAPESKVEMLNEYWASEASPADSFCHPIECSPKENPFTVHYVRTVPAPSSDSPLMYDLGVTYVATQGMPADGNIVGDLWVSYEIEFSKPIIKSNTHDEVRNGVLLIGDSSPSQIFGTVERTATGSLPFVCGSKTLTFPFGIIGTFAVHVDVQAVSNFTAVDFSGNTAFTNCTGAAIIPGGSSAYLSRTVSSSTNRATYVVHVTITDPSNQASLLLPSVAWTGTYLSTTVVVTSV